MAAAQIGNEVISDPSLPHQREILALVQLAVEAYEDESRGTILVITDYHEHARWLVNALHRSVQWDNDALRSISSKIKIHRDGIEVVGTGGRVLVVGASNIPTMFGTRPKKVVFFGTVGEMYYHIMSYGCPIEAVA